MRRLLFATLLLAFAGCGGHNSDYVEYEAMEPQPIELESVKLENQLLYCDDIYVHDNKLVILNTKNKNALFSLYSLPEMKLIGECGMVGRGPNEFEFINTRCTRSGATGFVVGGAVQYDVVDFEIGVDKLSLKKSFTMKYPSTYSSVNALVDLPNKFVVYAANEENTEFYLHNKTDGRAVPISSYPTEMLGVNASSMACSSIFLNRLLLAPSNNRFAAVYGQLPMVRIFSSSGEYQSTSLLKAWQEQRFDVNGDTVTTSDSFQYYLAACANDNYICGLYLGKRLADMQGVDMADVRMEIHVWNWAGELVATYLPDRLVNYIALAEDNTLYAVSLLDDRNVYKYKLK